MSMPQFSVSLFREQSKRLNHSSICRPATKAYRQCTFGYQGVEIKAFNEPVEKQQPWNWTMQLQHLGCDLQQRSEQPVFSNCSGDTGYEDIDDRHLYHHPTRDSESLETQFDQHDLQFVLADSDESAGRRKRQALKDHMLELV